MRFQEKKREWKNEKKRLKKELQSRMEIIRLKEEFLDKQIKAYSNGEDRMLNTLHILAETTHKHAKLEYLKTTNHTVIENGDMILNNLN